MDREIIIVDDHQGAREALLGMVEEAGYAAVAFANPAVALLRIAEHRPALVLLDMMMPEIDGADFLARLEPLHPGACLPVIIVSAMGHLLQGLQAPGRAGGRCRRGAGQAGGLHPADRGDQPGHRPTQSGGLTPDPRLGTIGCRGHDANESKAQISARRA